MADAVQAVEPGRLAGLVSRIADRMRKRWEKAKKRSWKDRIIGWFIGVRFLAFVLLLALAALRMTDPGMVQSLRLSVFDLFQNIKPRELPPEWGGVSPVAIVDIDEKSLADLGQWPWSRKTLAELVDIMTASGAGVIGFDVFFVEPDRTSPDLIADANPDLAPEIVAALRSLPSNEVLFADSIRNGRVVLGQLGWPVKTTQELPTANTPAIVGRGVPDGKEFVKETVVSFEWVTGNLPILDEAAAGHGLVTVDPESNNVVRVVPMIIEAQGKIYNSLAVEMLRLAFQKTGYTVRYNELGIQNIAITGDFQIPTDNQGRVYVNFRPHDQNLYIPAVDVLRGDAAGQLAGKFVLIGASAAGLQDIRATPIDPLIPGVEIHANILENIMTNQYLKRSLESETLEFLAAIAAGLMLIILVPMVGAGITAALLVAALGALGYYSWFEYSENLNLVDATYPGISTFALYTLMTFMGYTKTTAEKKQVRGAFSQYLSPALVEQLAEEPDRLQLGGEMKPMTLLFADIRGFTTISEQFKDDPQGLTTLINRFLTPMTDMILARNGTIDKYMGDCIMAFWNAPLDDPKHVEHASDSALAMFNALEELNREIEAEALADNRKFYEIKIGIGVNTGDAVVGNMGSDQRFDYSVLGDSVNLAARLEGQSKNYGVGIVIGETTQEVATDYATLELDLIAVKGKVEAVRIFTMLGDATMKAEPAFQKFATLHASMLEAYRVKDFDGTLTKVAECREADTYNLGVLYDLYEERANACKVDPPPEDWDAVFRAASK